MAQTAQHAVKVALWTSVLATAGSGGYYTAAEQGLAPRFWGGAELVADETSVSEASEVSQADFEAVASAWAGSLPAKQAKAPNVVEADEKSAKFESASDADDRYSVEEPVPEAPAPAQLALQSHEVTRGQEPADVADGVNQAIENAVETVASGVEDTSRRAREAFGDDLAAAVPQALGSDRYSAAGGSAAISESSPAQANPFSASSSPEPIAAPATLPRESSAEPITSANTAYRDKQAPGAQPFDYPTGATQENSVPIERESFGTTGDGTGHPGERELEGPQHPALIVQKFAPPEIQVGKSAKFAIQVRNAGNQRAEDVVIRDEVPHGTRVVNSTPKGRVDGNFVVWDVGALSAGEERIIEIELMPIAEGEIGSVATVSYTSQASAKTRCTMPQLAIRMTAPSQVMVGHEQRVKIELRNPGSGDATGVMLLENVPENVKHASGPALEFEIGTLKAGETRELELVLTAEKAGPVVNALTARADGNLQVQQQVEFEVIAPELQLAVIGPERRYLERPATYQVTIENPGTAPAHDIELVTKLPKGLQFVRANNMGEYDAGTHSIYWSLAQLPEGESGTVELVAMPIEPGQQIIQVEGKAQEGLTDEVKQNIEVEGLAAIMFEVRDAQDPIEVGGETQYDIRVENQGTKAATNVQVVVSLPPGMSALSASGETKHTIQPGGGVVFEPLAQLAPKTDTVYRVQVKGVQPGDQRVTVQVNTDDISQPIRREESTRVFGDE